MYHDLLLALSGFTGDIFIEESQKESYPIVKIATGLSLISPAEEAFLNRDILPLAGHVLYLKRFSDEDPEIFRKSKPLFYLQALRNALALFLDAYADEIEDLEQEVLSSTWQMSLAKIHSMLIDWYIPFETIATCIYNTAKFDATLIDKFITIADSSGNQKTNYWLKFLADRLALVFESQTKELLKNQNLIDPYEEYFIKNISDVNIDFTKLPLTFISKQTAKKISYICRTMFITNKVNEKNSLVSKIAKQEEFNMSNATEVVENMASIASRHLLEFIGSDELFDFFEVLKNLFFLADATVWIEFIERVKQPVHARKIFNEISDQEYEKYGVEFSLKEDANKADNAEYNKNCLEQSFYHVEELEKYVAPVNDAWGKNPKNKVLAMLSLEIKIPHPFDLIFDEWAIEKI